jgi:hypothetical protein
MTVFIRPGPIGTHEDEISPWRYLKRDNGVAPSQAPFPGSLTGEPDYSVSSFGSLGSFDRPIHPDRGGNTFASSQSLGQATMYKKSKNLLDSETKPTTSPADDVSERICPNMTNKEFVEEFNTIRKK